MGVELLYVDGCPHGENYVPDLRRLVARARPGADVTVRRIAGDAEARATRFVGSPTVRVDGHDVEPGADERTDYAMACRLYRSEDGVHGTPPDDWVRDALRRLT